MPTTSNKVVTLKLTQEQATFALNAVRNEKVGNQTQYDTWIKTVTQITEAMEKAGVEKYLYQ